MKIVVGVASAVVGVAASFALGASSAAAALPTCPEASEILLLSAPKLSRVGEGIELRVQTIAPERVANVVVGLGSKGGSREVPVALTGGTTRVILDSGPKPDLEAEIGVEWDQDLATPAAACHGATAYALPNLPAGASVGDPQVPRFADRFMVRGGPPRRRWHEQWWLTPRCEYFGCRTRVGTTRLFFLPDATGAYTMHENGGRVDTCKVKWRRGYGPWHTKRIRRAWRLTIEYVLRPTVVLGGLIQAFRGKIFYYYEPTSYAERWHCKFGQFSEPMRGRRISGR